MERVGISLEGGTRPPMGRVCLSCSSMQYDDADSN